MMTKPLQLTERECFTVLAALQAWQHVLVLNKCGAEHYDELIELATDGHRVNGLTLGETQNLAQKVSDSFGP